MKIQFNGPEEETTAYGLAFPKGKAVDIDGLSAAFQAKLLANPVFSKRETLVAPRPLPVAPAPQPPPAAPTT